MTYNQEVKLLAGLCKKCGGRCCRETGKNAGITASRFELKRLEAGYNFMKGYIKTPYGKISMIKFMKNTCPFLGKTGCSLKPEVRPLGCRLFPLTFLIERGKLRFYLSAFCPCAREAVKLKVWVRKQIRDARRELRRWTKREKLSRSFLHRKIHQNNKYLTVI